MTSGTATRPAVLVSAGRIARFTKVMYKPHYLLYGILWVLALEGTAALVSQADSAWRPTGATVARIAIVAVVLLYLRMVDEQKDLEYDRVNNPDRPLVTGAVSAGELRTAMGIIAVGSIAGSLALSPWSAVMIAAVLVYGLILWGLEQLSETVRTDILLNLVVTYPVQLLVTAYVAISAMDTGEVAGSWRILVVAVVFAGAFLQFEFARKTSREQRPGELLYSNALGTKGSVAVSLLLAVVAVGAELAVAQPWTHDLPAAAIGWIPLALLLLPLAGAWRFRSSGDTDYPVIPAVVFILTLYLALIAQALVLTGN
ncbi:UbiA family prenyltransferase [Nocardia huaxiensis]|uniref:UbiA family prenyltransferase n=1 Tax=Nocardia huaxiensis TaxID=2755382 RepID=UPI001E3594F9|nr:UbiA family prenyltransferase [Nocardia huaxiensis]UFS99781.1 UbiA family prenyltransferase [Nocardia huaxiensis]